MFWYHIQGEFQTQAKCENGRKKESPIPKISEIHIQIDWDIFAMVQAVLHHTFGPRFCSKTLWVIHIKQGYKWKSVYHWLVCWQ